MTFNDDARLDTSQVGSGGSGGGFRPGGIVVGGGGGCLTVVVLLVLFLTGNLGLGGGEDSGGSQGQGSQGQERSAGGLGVGGDLTSERISQCRTGADANRDDTCRAIGTVNSVQDYWARELPEQSGGRTDYARTKTMLYSGSMQSACGTASNQVGPFYCPLDRQVYLDVDFFDELTTQFGADGGPFAQMYVVAHEYGHSVQDQLGLLERAQQDPQGAESGGVRVELMADCLAGMWAKDASTTKDADGHTLLQPLTQREIDSALSAASAVGDDRIQQRSQGRVSPENFTHGTAAQRQKWFMTGYERGSLRSCDTFSARRL